MTTPNILQVFVVSVSRSRGDPALFYATSIPRRDNVQADRRSERPHLLQDVRANLSPLKLQDLDLNPSRYK
jgi:hypothetical protein